MKNYKWPVARQSFLFVCAGLVFVALIANAVIKFWNLQTIIINDQKVAHSHRVNEQLGNLLVTVINAETGIRGYVITGKPEFLKPYDDAKANAKRDFDALANLVRDNHEQMERLEAVWDLFEDHQTFMVEVLETRKGNQDGMAHELIRSGRGKSVMDAIRRKIGEIVTNEEKLLEARMIAATSHHQTSLFAGVAGTGLSLLMTALAVGFFWQELRIRRSAETALHSQIAETHLKAEQFRLLTETVPVLIWISRPDGTPIFLNGGWAMYAGVDPRTIDVKKWRGTFHPEDLPRIDAVWNADQIPDSGLFLDEVRVLSSSDQTYRIHRFAAVPIRMGRLIESWICSLVDIQDQKDHAEVLERTVQQRTQELRTAIENLSSEVNERIRAEALVNAVATELRRSNEELEKFAYVASHDLQEPLRKIQAFGDRLFRKYENALDEQGRVYLDRILAAATRMRSLIEDLLTFSRVASVTKPFVPIDLNATLAEVLSDLETRLTQTNGRVDSSPLPTIHGDPMQIRQLMQNLIGNGLKFGKKDLSPVISITATRLDHLVGEVDPPKPNFQGWRLAFKDNGIGFEKTHENRIFEIFQRLHGRNQYEGTGIGLAICRKIVDRHGGVISARGELGVGATFFIDLPGFPQALGDGTSRIREWTAPPEERNSMS